jgi:hypothetical protein
MGFAVAVEHRAGGIVAEAAGTGLMRNVYVLLA